MRQAEFLQRLLGRGYRAVAHDGGVDTRQRHALDPGDGGQAQGLGLLGGHHQHGGGAVGNLRRGARGDRAALGIESRRQCGQAFQGGFRADGFIVLNQGQRAVLVVTLDGDDFAGELAFHRGLVGQLVGAQAQLVLRFAADAVHQGQVLGGHAHHAGGLGHVQAHARVGVHLVHHRQVAQVLHAAHQVDVAHVRP